MDHYMKLPSRPLPPHRTQLHPRMHLPSPQPPKPPLLTRRHWWLSLLALPFLLYLFIAARRTHLSSHFALPTSAKSYYVLISASRGGSRAHVFEFLNEGRIPFGPGAVSAKARPGIGVFVGRPEAAGRSMLGLLEFARRVVPKGEWGRTEVRLMESGGLRGVSEEEGRILMEECRKVLRSSGFAFRDEWARSIAGKERGVYAWVAVNYVLGTLGEDPQQTTGVVEFEGATVQITFSAKKQPPKEFLYSLKLPTMNYNLYARSVHQFDQETSFDFLEKIHDDKIIPPLSPSPDAVIGTRMNACIPKGYSKTYNLHSHSASDDTGFAYSLGNLSECRSQSLKLFQDEKVVCSQRPCEMLSKLVLNMRGEDVMSENFLYTSELFGLFPRASLSHLEASAKHYCEDDWVELQKEHFHVDEADLLKYCYSSSYLLAFLHDHLGIPMEKQSVGLTNQSGSSSDWTLGAFILRTMAESGQESDNSSHSVRDDSLTYLVLLTILFLLLLVIFFVWRSQKPQLKMIYDLGQGHYIVSRQSLVL